jgi:hypothetical protein
MQSPLLLPHQTAPLVQFLSLVRRLSGCSPCVIKDLFQLSPQVVAPTYASYAPGNVILHLPANTDKESEAKKGIVKLMLLHIPTLISRQHHIKHHSSRSIEGDAGGSESASCSSSQSIHRSCANDIRVGQASRLHQYPINSDIDSGHVKDLLVPYAPREFCDQEAY